VVRVRAGGANVSIVGSFDHAREPKASSDAVVFTGFLGTDDGSDSDVFLYDVAGKSVTQLQVEKGQQRFADVSAAHVAWSDFAEDPTGVYSGDGTSLADVVLYDRVTKKSQVIKLTGKQAFPMLAVSGSVGFLDWLAFSRKWPCARLPMRLASSGSSAGPGSRRCTERAWTLLRPPWR
jgi:hypothetical protein